MKSATRVTPSRPRICIIGYKRLSHLVHSVIDEYSTRADIEVIDEVFDAALKAARYREQEKLADAFISGGANASILRATLSSPVARIKVSGYDILLAMLKAGDISDRVGLITYGETDAQLDSIKALLKLKIDQRAYRSADEAKDCCMSLISAGFSVIVGSSVVVDLAEQHGVRGILAYSRGAVRQAIEDAIELAYAARLEAIKFEQIDSVLRHLSEAVVAVDEHEQVTAINPAMEHVLGVTRREAIGHKLGALSAQASLKSTIDQDFSEHAAVTNIGHQTYIANKVPIHSQGVIAGAVMTLMPASAIQHADTNLRTEKRPGHPVAKYHFEQIAGSSKPFVQACNTAKRYARTSSTVLITGESGTGKELFAQAIHNASDRSRNPFIALNCAAFPEQLLESELFGYEEGAFTGSRKGGKPGLLEVAHTGTVFLDEIGDMPVSLQTRLLRVLQEKEVIRLGGTQPIPVNVRVIAATHHILQDRIRQGLFRSDLFYRLNILHLHLPSLRDRHDDIAVLAIRLLQSFLDRAKIPLGAQQILAPLMPRLIAYDWPGNVRELENVAERLASFAVECTTPESLDDSLIRQNLPEIFSPHVGLATNDANSLDVESVKAALTKTHGNRRKAAEQLGVSRTTLWRWLKSHEAAGLPSLTRRIIQSSGQLDESIPSRSTQGSFS
ncbi:MAG: propionate catabolism operon regulatory protein PrpR [Castellaniella sp.]